MIAAEVFRGSPADRHSVEPGSTIDNLSLKQNPGGSTEVRLSFTAPAGQERDLTFEAIQGKARSRARPSSWLTLPRRTAVAKLNAFDEGSFEWLANQVRIHRPDHLILDLRRNQGGVASIMKRVAGMFLPDRSIIGYEVKSDGKEGWYTSGPPIYTGRLTVLVGPITASAAEVIAAALQFHGRARIFGGRTAGNVLLARTYRLPDGGRIELAEREFLPPTLRSIEGIGIQPDIAVASDLKSLREDRDAVLEAALH